MKQIASFALIVWLYCPALSRGAEAAGWGSDLTNALKTAHEKQRPVLLAFTAPWCPYCRMMESKVFMDKPVDDLLNQFERISVNIDHNAELAAQHAVSGIPAFVILDSEGEETAKTSGYMEADAFAGWLTAGVTNLNVSAAQKEEFQNRSHLVEAALSDPDPTSRAKGLVMVLDCCERKEKLYRNFGTTKLQALSQSEPGLLLNGLNHPGLMARIRVANLLRERIGNDFNIDPWEKPEVREKAVREWQARLASKSGPGK
jgi:thioredoxin-related protein